MLVTQWCPTLLRPHGPTRLLCPWNSPGKNAGVGFYFLLPDPGIEPRSPALQSDSLTIWATREAHIDGSNCPTGGDSPLLWVRVSGEYCAWFRALFIEKTNVEESNKAGESCLKHFLSRTSIFSLQRGSCNCHYRQEVRLNWFFIASEPEVRTIESKWQKNRFGLRIRKNSFINSAVQSCTGFTSKGMSPQGQHFQKLQWRYLKMVYVTLLKDGIKAGVSQIFC